MALTKVKKGVVDLTAWEAINDLTALSATPDVADEFPIYDDSGSVARKVTMQEVLDGVGSLATASPVLADLLMIGDASASNAAKSNTVQTVLDTLGTVTTLSSVDASADLIPVYDNSASATKNILVEDLLPFTKSYDSGQQTISNGSQLVLPHSLGTQPLLVVTSMINVVAQTGFTLNEEIIVNPMWDYTNNYGTAITVDATNVTVRYGSSGQLIMRTDNGVAATAVTASWRYRFRAFA